MGNMTEKKGQKNKKVIVIGAGVGGLGAGYWLAEKGIEVEVLEATHRAGGRMHTMTRNGDRFEAGACFTTPIIVIRSS